MARWRHASCFVALALGGLVISIQAQSGAVTQPAPRELAGRWAYNPTESINAATGRPERAPKGPGRQPTLPTPASVPVTPSAPPSAMGSLAGPTAGTVPPDSFGFSRPGDVGPTVAMIQENRSLTRDLMEIPETLTITVDPQAVTFIDDLNRSRTYPLTGERRRYQLGAARFNAATFWSDSRLEKKIDAADGFRMTETYYVSEAARRLFVLLRVGSSRKGAPMMAVNRVYDRVDP